MFRRAFDEELPICWYLYEEDQSGLCRVREYLAARPVKERDRVIARMKEWARFGSWQVRLSYIKQLDLSEKLAKKATIYEVKSFQDRIFFIRCGNDAIAIDGIVKKANWNKRAQRVLEAAVFVAEAATKEWQGG